MLLFKHLLESKGLNSMIMCSNSEVRRSKRAKVDESVLELLQSIYRNASKGQQKHYDQAIEELREEVRGCQKKFAVLQELFIQAIKARLNPGYAEVDMALLKELWGMIKEEEWSIAKRELEGLLEKEVFEQEKATMGSEESSFAFRIKRPPTSASEVSSFGSGQCEKCSGSRYAMCLF